MSFIPALILIASCGAPGGGAEFAQELGGNSDVHCAPHDWPGSDEQETLQTHNDDEVLLLQLRLNTTSADSVVHLNASQAVGPQLWRPPKVLGPGNRTIEEVRAYQSPNLVISYMSIFLVVLLVLTVFSAGPIGDSLIACSCFGSTLFLVIAYNAMFAEGLYAFLEGKFIVTGFAGVILIALLYEGCSWGHIEPVRRTLHRKIGTGRFLQDLPHEVEIRSMDKLSRRQTLLYLVGPGLAQVCCEITASIAFAYNIEAAGVNGVIVVSDPLVYGLFFYFYKGEELTTIRLWGFFLAAGGIMMIGILSETEGVSGSGLATIFAVFSMLFAGTFSTLSRFSALSGVRIVGAAAWRSVVIGAAGLCLTWVVLEAGPDVLPESLPIWALTGGGYDVLATFALNRSFMHKDISAAVNGVILAACPVFSIFLCVMFMDLQQTLLKYVSAAIALSGVMLLITT